MMRTFGKYLIWYIHKFMFNNQRPISGCPKFALWFLGVLDL